MKPYRMPTGVGRVEAGLLIQFRVFNALVLRELHMRYGRENLGFLWVIGEPMILATVITLLHLNQPTHFASDIQPAPFAIIGYTIYIIFRNTFNRAEGAIETSQPLLYHRQVSILDVILSRVMMEILGCFATIVILLTLAISFGLAAWPERPLYLLTAAILMGWWTLGLTMIAACVTYRNEIVGRQLHVLSYLSLPISGAFLQMSWIPAPIREWLQWFPMPLIFEQARYGQFRAAPASYVHPAYVSAVCAVLTYLGLLLTRRMGSKVHG